MTTKRLSPMARLRLLRRAISVLNTNPATIEQLDHFANHLGDHGLAATVSNLDDLVADVRILEQLNAGAPASQFLDMVRFFGTDDEAHEWLTAKLERNVRHLERYIAGA